MIVPKIPADDAQRLDALQMCDILDTESEEAFDDITKLAALICEAPVSLISLVDKDRQWFKSSHGLDVKETPRSIAFCAHAINEPNEIMEVKDTLLDQRFCDNPFVINEPKIRFYAGSPLVDSNGNCLGTLCVIDFKPRQVTKEQKEMLAFLSKQVIAQIELRKKNHEIEKAHGQIAKDQEKLDKLINQVGDIIYELDHTGKFIYVNPAIVKITGYSKKTLLNAHFWELAIPGEEDKLGKYYLKIIKKNIKSDYHEFQMRTKTGPVWVGQNVEIEYKDGRVVHVYAVARDISIQKKHHEELAKIQKNLVKSEERYRLLSENSRDVITLTDRHANYLFLSSSVKEFLGYEPEELKGVNAFDITHPDDAMRMRDEETGIDKIEATTGTFITRVRKKDGSYIWMESIIRAIRDDNKEVTGYQVSSRDISKRNINEQKIIRNQAKIEALIENTDDAICVIDKEHKYLSFNKSFKDKMELFNGFTPKVGELFDFDSFSSKSPGFELSVKKAMQNNKFNVLHSFEMNKKRWYFDCYYNPVINQDDDIIGLTIRIQDVTEKTERAIKSELFGKATTRLNELFSQTNFTLYEHINQVFSVALEYFELDIAALSTIEKDDYRVLFSSSRDKEIQISAKDRFDSRDMYCNDVFRKSMHRAIDISNEEEFKKHSCRKKLGLKAYIGAPYHVNNRKKGTIWLAAKKNKNSVFGEQEIEFINMLARGVGFLIERHEYRDQLLTEQIVLKAFVFSAPASIAMFNENLEYIALSKKWKQQYNLIQPDVLGKYYGELSPHLKSSWNPVLKECLKGRVEKNDCFKNYKEDGSEQWLKWEVRPWVISKDNIGGVIMFTEDITNQIRQQEELTKAKEIAENASKAKEQFLSTMSHEIRTPMNAIIGAANLLLREKPQPDQIENLNLLKFSSDNLLSLINDILDFNKIEAGKIEFEEIDFNFKDLLLEIKQTLKLKAEEKGVDLILKYDDELPDVFIGDSVRISQIITNLVGNAVKFTQEGFIKIEVRNNGSNGKKIKLNVRIQDTGVGIEEHSQKKIFDDFSQASDNITRKYGGTGLGLSITRRLLALMGSTIKVESQPNKGTVFYFDLELIPGDPQRFGLSSHAFDTSTDSLSDKNINILVAEDNQANRQIVKQFLSVWNVNTEFAENGREAVEKVAKEKYDLILMDLRMPEMDGYEAATTIRNKTKEYFKNIPIIALTASATSDIKKRALQIGMNDFISKPFNPDELHQKILKHAPQFKSRVKYNNVSVTENEQETYKDVFPYLYQIADGDESMITDIIRSVIDTVPSELDRLSSLIAERNFELFAEIIHKIKPNLVSLELPALVEIGDELEEAAETENKIVINEKLDSFLSSVRDELLTVEKKFLA